MTRYDLFVRFACVRACLLASNFLVIWSGYTDLFTFIIPTQLAVRTAYTISNLGAEEGSNLFLVTIITICEPETRCLFLAHALVVLGATRSDLHGGEVRHV